MEFSFTFSITCYRFQFWPELEAVKWNFKLLFVDAWGTCDFCNLWLNNWAYELSLLFTKGSKARSLFLFATRKEFQKREAQVAESGRRIKFDDYDDSDDASNNK